MMFLPKTTFLEAWRDGLCGFDSDLTATGLLDVAFLADGEDFVATVLLESVVPEVVPGREVVVFVPEATGREEVVIVPVAVIGAVGLADY